MKEIRLQRLRDHMHSRNLTVNDLISKTGKRQSYWSDLLAGKKSFGERAARSIEESLGLPSGYLDTEDVPDWRAIAKNMSKAWDLTYGTDMFAKFVLEVDRLYNLGKSARSAGGESSTPHANRDKRTQGQPDH